MTIPPILWQSSAAEELAVSDWQSWSIFLWQNYRSDFVTPLLLLSLTVQTHYPETVLQIRKNNEWSLRARQVHQYLAGYIDLEDFTLHEVLVIWEPRYAVLSFSGHTILFLYSTAAQTWPTFDFEFNSTINGLRMPWPTHLSCYINPHAVWYKAGDCSTSSCRFNIPRSSRNYENND